MGFFARQPGAVQRHNRQCAVGDGIYLARQPGLAWRVERGVVRLDLPQADGQTAFASLAIAGDIIGCESLLFGCYNFSAAALTACELSPWPEGERAPASASLLHSLAASQQRAAEVLALRGGEAINRVLSLIRLLSDEAGCVVLPTRQDIADITDLRFETISRLIKRLERADILQPFKQQGVHASRSFGVNFQRAGQLA